MARYACLIVCLYLLSGIIDAQDDKAPYLYYYSQALNGIIIERADGTNSRIIGQKLIQYPKQVFAVYGPGWSPDGRYAALVDNEHFAELYDAKTAERLATLNIGAIELWFSEDSRTLYTRSRFAVAEWEVAEVIAHARKIEGG